MNATTYILGHHEEELARLELQSKALAPITARILSEVGLGRGLRVLDIGTGAGDVAMAAAALVGPNGRVLGIDRSDAAVERATQRARAARLQNVTFETADFPANLDGRLFDLVIGRYVLIHQSDPVIFLRRASTFVDVGGAMAFIEMAVSEGPSSTPVVESYEAVRQEISAAFRDAGADLQVGNKFGSLFAKAGLPTPSLVSETPVASGASWMLEWVARTVDSVRPPEVREREPWRAISQRIKADVVSANSQVFGPRNVAAWVRIDF